ncbi:MAG: S9 family peptidase [bacterium]
MKKKRKIRAEDLYNARIISDNTMSPDRSKIVFTVLFSVREDNDKNGKEKKYSHLYMTDLSTDTTRQFTRGKHSDIHPVWSRDSKKIYFLSNREDEKQFQIYAIDVDGGEAEKLTDMKGQFNELCIAPDNRRIAFRFTAKDSDDDIKYRRYTRSFFKSDGSGYLDNNRSHIFTLNLSNGRIKQITKGEYDHSSPVWTKDSKYIIFMSNQSPDPHLELWKREFYRIKAIGGRIEKIDTFTGYKYMHQLSPCGRYMAFLGIRTKTRTWRNARIWIKDLEKGGKPLCINPEADYNTGLRTLNDLSGSHRHAFKWSKDSRYIYLQASYHGSTNLRRIELNGHCDEPVIDNKGVVGNFDIAGDNIYHFFGNMKNPGEICEYNLHEGKMRQLTDLNKWVEEIDLGEIERIYLKRGDSPLQGWILKPPGFSNRKKYPSILEIHGGPHLQYGEFFMHEFYYLAAQGYVVHFCNPRGSTGYGESFTGAINNNWGTVDYEDIIRWTDYVQRKKYIDGKSMGVTGGSYGGYMTNWIIGHTGRFDAAVTQRSVSNLYSMWGSSDFNWAFQHEFGLKPPFMDPDNYLRQSPISFIGNASTPTMVIHSMNDFRCPIEQGEQIYVALKYLGIETEFIVFPGEPHGLSRNGRADRRIARLEHIKRWFERYLKK